MRRAFDDLIAERDVDERAALLVDDPEHVGVFEKDRGLLGIYRLLVRQLRDIGGDRPDLAASDREARGVFRKAEPPLMPPVRA